MDIFLYSCSILCGFIAIIGSIVPMLPGPVLGYLSLWMAQWSGVVSFSSNFMWWLFGIGVVVFAADYVLPSLITKSTGASKQASWGALIGSIAGMFLTPIGMILGMMIGAFIGQSMSQNSSTERSVIAAFGAFLGFLVGTGIKLMYCGYILWAIIAELF